MATILVVDDRPTNRQYLTTLLGYGGHRLLEAGDGVEALAVALAETPDLAIVDIVMPALDGYGLVRRLRLEPALAGMPVIFYTATYLEPAARQLAETCGVSYVLTKPADPEVVLRVVGEALGITETIEPSSRLAPPPDDPMRLLTVGLSSKLEHVVPRLTALIEVGVQFSVEKDLERLLQRLCHAARKIIGARHAFVGVLEDDGQSLRHVLTSGDVDAEPAPRIGSLPLGAGVLGSLLSERRPIRLPDHRVWPGRDGVPPDACPFLGVPFASANELHGFVCVTGKIGEKEFSEEDERIAVTLAAQAATRYENAKLYAELQEHTTQLQFEVAERARLDAELQRRMEDLAKANRRKDEFLAMLAHELRNPLAAISSSVRLLGRHSLGDPVLERARDAAARQAVHMARLLDDLLDVSRVTQGKITLLKEDVALADVIESAVDSAGPAIRERGHRFYQSVPQEPLQVCGDPVRLAQAVGNILANAAKYTDPAGEIHLSAVRDGDEVAICVRDSGIGIPAEILPHIFDLFVQGDNSLERAQGGLGIGLTMVRSLVEMHGGRIEAHSGGEGRGSEFVVHLPLVEAPNAGDEGRSCTGQPARPRRILVVDDNVDAAVTLAMLLELDGHEVVTANSGQEALGLAREYQPEVVLLDIGMPGMDGHEVSRRMRQEPAMARAVLVALTGYGQEEDRERAIEAGCDDHLIKPVDMDALKQALQTSGRHLRETNATTEVSRQ